MMKENSRQDHGGLGTHVAGQGILGFEKRCGFRCRSGSGRTGAGPHPSDHSLAQKNNQTETATGGLAQHVLSQLLVVSDPIRPDCELRQRFVQRSFF